MMMILMENDTYRESHQKRNWMKKTRNSSLVCQHATHCFLPWIPKILHGAFVPFQNITNAGNRSILWKKFFRGMNVIARHLNQIRCDNMYVERIQICGAALVFECFQKNCIQAPLPGKGLPHPKRAKRRRVRAFIKSTDASLHVSYLSRFETIQPMQYLPITHFLRRFILSIVD